MKREVGINREEAGRRLARDIRENILTMAGRAGIGQGDVDGAGVP